METTPRPTTPGYNCHLFVAFSYDRHGKKIAYYLSRGLGSMRWIRMSVADALLFVAQGLASETTYIRNA